MENKNKPAFPDTARASSKMISGEFPSSLPTGLTKREYASFMAMQGLLSNYDVQVRICTVDPRYNGNNFAEVIAINSLEFADALLKELEK